MHYATITRALIDDKVGNNHLKQNIYNISNFFKKKKVYIV